jgi:hypothetical protein
MCVITELSYLCDYTQMFPKMIGLEFLIKLFSSLSFLNFVSHSPQDEILNFSFREGKCHHKVEIV